MLTASLDYLAVMSSGKCEFNIVSVDVDCRDV